MVEQGRSADRDTDSVRGETPLQSGSEKRISPRNISAEYQYVRVETGKDRTRELRQLFAVDVEKTARSRIGVVPGGDIPRTGQGLTGQLFVTADNSARREGFIHDSAAERQAVDPAVGRHLIARSHQFTVGYETRPDACSERERHHAPGIARRAAETIAPASAELLWETSDGLISELVLSDGIVSFNTSAGKGNALIAVKDQQGRIMWSWHIWCTDLPADQVYMANKYGNSYTFMDRSLGATSALDDTGSLGMSYQWGRKDPIPGSSKFYDMTEPTLYGSVTKVSVAASDASTGTIANAIQNPVTFLKAADWLFAGRNNYLWGNPQGEEGLTATHQKSIYDPCPPGYRIPGKDAFSIFTKTGENTTDPAQHNVVNTSPTKRGWYLYYAATGSGEQAWFPYNGCRYYSSGALNRGSFYYYWTSAPSAGTKSCCLAFKNDWKEVDPLYTFQRGNAQTIRCVKE